MRGTQSATVRQDIRNQLALLLVRGTEKNSAWSCHKIEHLFTLTNGYEYTQ